MSQCCHVVSLRQLRFLFCLDIELITLEVTSPFVGAGLNRESLLTSYERMLTAHPNIRLVMLGELFVVLF